MIPAVSPAKLTTNPAVLPLKRRVTGFSSFPPFCRLARVTAKSAALRAATVTNRARFSLSQNLWWLGASGRVLATTGEAATAPELAGPGLTGPGLTGPGLPGAGLTALKLSGPSLRVAMDTP